MMTFAERMMIALASAKCDGSTICYKLGTAGELCGEGTFRIRWESASEKEMIVRGVAEAYGDDVPDSVAGPIAVQVRVSDRDDLVMLGDFSITDNRPEWAGAIGDVIILHSLGQPALSQADVFGVAQ